MKEIYRAMVPRKQAEPVTVVINEENGTYTACIFAGDCSFYFDSEAYQELHLSLAFGGIEIMKRTDPRWKKAFEGEGAA